MGGVGRIDNGAGIDSYKALRLQNLQDFMTTVSLENYFNVMMSQCSYGPTSLRSPMYLCMLLVE